MTNEATNFSSQIVIKNNIWTLTKHLTSSVNKTAGKLDAKVYGPIVEARTVQLPPQAPPPLPPEDNSIFTIIGYIVVGLFVITAAVVGFISYCKGDIRGRDFIGF